MSVIFGNGNAVTLHKKEGHATMQQYEIVKMKPII